jgi:hypothetical protein
MTFEEIAVELCWTVKEAEEFGTQFFGRAFAERSARHADERGSAGRS